MAVSPQVLKNIPEGGVIKSSSGTLYKKSTISGRPSFSQLDSAPSGVTPLEEFESGNQPGALYGGGKVKLSEVDLLASGSIIPRSYSDPGGNIALDAYQRDLAGVGVPRIGGDSAKTMTGDKLAAILAHGSDPANTPFQGEKSSGYEISKKIAGLLPQRQGLSPDAGAPFPSLGPEPTPPSAVGEEQRLATAYGLDTLQGQAVQLDDAISKIQNDLLTQQEAIAGQPVSSRVMSKETSMATRKAAQQLRDLRLQRTELTRQISVANRGISMMMSAEKIDYANAKSLWEFEYNKNIQYYNSLDKQATTQEKQDKASLQGILNMLGTGKTKMEELSPEIHNHLDELMMRVFGSDFLGFQNEVPEGNAIFRKSFTGSDGKKYLLNLYENPDGTFKIDYTTPVSAKKTSNLTPEEKKFDTDLARARRDLAAGGGWGKNWDYLKQQYNVPNETLDKLLNKEKYYTQQ